jgi:flagellar basal body-associated protein FliL
MTATEIILIVLAALVFVAVVVFFVLWLIRKNGVSNRPKDQQTEETEESPAEKLDEKK